MKPDPFLYVFPHLPKTAGFYFKCNIEGSYPPPYLLRAAYEYTQPFYNIKTRSMDFYRGYDHFREHLQSFTQDEINQIKCIGGHNAYLGIHQLVNKPARYFTFIRNPIARTVSLYNYQCYAWEVNSKIQNPSIFNQTIVDRISKCFLIDSKIPDFEEWLLTRYDQPENHVFYHSMINYLQYLQFIDHRRDSHSIEEALNHFYFVGLTENYNRDAYFLYDLLKVKYYTGEENKSPSIIQLKNLSPSVLNLIHDKNNDDLLLYEHAQRANARFIREQRRYHFYFRRAHATQRFQTAKVAIKDILRPWVRPVLCQLGLR